MEQLRAVAALVRARNALDAEIAAVIDRPALSGHLAEGVAWQVCDVHLEAAANAKGIDGRFGPGAPLAEKTVNVKYHGKREGILNTTDYADLDYYLVLSGPKATVMTSKGGTRPWAITHVYLFDAKALHTDQAAHGVKSGIASSVRNDLWDAAEIYPQPNNPAMPLSDEQCAMLALFRPTPYSDPVPEASTSANHRSRRRGAELRASSPRSSRLVVRTAGEVSGASRRRSRSALILSPQTRTTSTCRSRSAASRAMSSGSDV